MMAFMISLERSGELTNSSFVLLLACWMSVSDSRSLPFRTLLTYTSLSSSVSSPSKGSFTVPHELLQVKRRSVVEAKAGLAQQKRLRGQARFLLICKLS